jgi:type VI secretion system protein ImpK
MRLVDCWMPVFNALGPLLSAGQALDEQLRTLCDQALARSLAHGYTEDEAREALFVAVAWIDEQAMTRLWSGRDAWPEATLQAHYFAMSSAGVAFYQHLEALPEKATALREVYALALLAGFEGRLAGSGEAERARYRRSFLQRVVTERDASALEPEQPLFIQPVLNGVSGGRRGRRRFSWLIVLLTLGLPLVLLGSALEVYGQRLVEQAQALLEQQP